MEMWNLLIAEPVDKYRNVGVAYFRNRGMNVRAAANYYQAMCFLSTTHADYNIQCAMINCFMPESEISDGRPIGLSTIERMKKTQRKKVVPGYYDAIMNAVNSGSDPPLGIIVAEIVAGEARKRVPFVMISSAYPYSDLMRPVTDHVSQNGWRMLGTVHEEEMMTDDFWSRAFDRLTSRF